MPFAGHVFKPREAAAFIAPKWQSSQERHKALAVMLGESKACVGAWNDNLAESGELLSRDCGLFQISVRAAELEAREPLLRSESQEPSEYEPVASFNVGIARLLYDTPWPIHKRRLWQPWVAYTSGWATFPEWWVWRHALGEPTGPWVPTGRYIQKAILGWANWHLLIAQTKNPAGALASAFNAQVKWKVEGELRLAGGKVAWASYPPKPEEPPADGHGPRPAVNDGR